MKVVLSWLIRWACRAGTRDLFSAWAALVGTVQNIFLTFSIPLHVPNPIAQQPAQAAVLARLYFSMWLWLEPTNSDR
jgi:hypothetical protein